MTQRTTRRRRIPTEIKYTVVGAVTEVVMSDSQRGERSWFKWGKWPTRLIFELQDEHSRRLSSAGVLLIPGKIPFDDHSWS